MSGSVARRVIKNRLFEEFARIGSALSSPKRLELLDLISQGEKTVELLAEQADLGLKNTSAHLRHLREARLVETRRGGRYVHYRLADEGVLRFLRELQSLARLRLAEADRLIRMHYERPEELEPIGSEELLRRVRAGSVVVLDVRPEDEYRSGHIPDAISVPIEELERRLHELPGDREIIAYCRGPYCTYASEAVTLLVERGLRARRLEDGLPDWRMRGLPVATAP